MLYQPSAFGLFFLFGLDLAALALLYFLIRSPFRWERVLLYGAAVLLVLFSSFLKLFFSELATGASTPGDLQIKNRLSSSFRLSIICVKTKMASYKPTGRNTC
ncbi:hypothetical protein [Hymenobacter defluvii]|uniref:Uncharacterized protein n=1 Tax=Hymenobacter defluvii TaxID=2054411 RepID=A0ABS3TCW6_9BACT|nr:hypothetical protein [Hymenobacter defluvii]MBO3271497.1 hypothetical protein [Hymenobacter defluvii]